MHTLALLLLLGSPQVDGKGLIEHYEDLIAVNPARTHNKRADDLNRLIPKIVDDLLFPSVGFYVAPGSDRKLELTNKTDGDLTARYACFEKDGSLVSKSDWITIASKTTDDLRCEGDKQYIFVEWGSDEPAPGVVREVLDEIPLE